MCKRYIIVYKKCDDHLRATGTPHQFCRFATLNRDGRLDGTEFCEKHYRGEDCDEETYRDYFFMDYCSYSCQRLLDPEVRAGRDRAITQNHWDRLRFIERAVNPPFGKHHQDLSLEHFSWFLQDNTPVDADTLRLLDGAAEDPAGQHGYEGGGGDDDDDDDDEDGGGDDGDGGGGHAGGAIEGYDEEEDLYGGSPVPLHQRQTIPQHAPPALQRASPAAQPGPSAGLQSGQADNPSIQQAPSGMLPACNMCHKRKAKVNPQSDNATDTFF